ncbi:MULTISPECIES: FAD-dependent monooxygenase [unclassified Crossiella]|uniref:FAD-dependent monooxygenase n=1 Tax=unclassified Crossiella TaxID=2620835 RepID=UPI001FFEEF09|nr:MULTISPECIES: FAD-dependent monooxygenase [unclassified Crossiella]MCK2243982.1 FAD-dependent monooxygenase [Crossiella sp. S99.2]MCK2257160.1 FAD-dependent monooxygenase [Crossiella sp. S99.1]
MNFENSHHDVLVVGAGPVGLLLAAELRLGGASVLVLDRLAEPSAFSKAFGLGGRTLDLFDQRGLLDRLPADAHRWQAGHFAGLPTWLTYDRLPTAHPYVVRIAQHETERILAERVIELGGELRRGHEVTALHQDPDGVTATVDSPQGTYTVRSAYLAGCDGGRSTIRKLAGIDFPGSTGETASLLGDVVITAEPDTGLTRTDTGTVFIAPTGDGLHRVVPTRFDQPPPEDDADPTLDELRDALRAVLGTDLGAHSPRWLSRLRHNSRIAATYRSGRVLLAGDAAHVHAPIGGQGLNLGFGDALNLGWKLLAALRGRDDLLDTYELERRPAAENVLANTRAQFALFRPGEQVNALRDLLDSLLDIPEVNDRLAAITTSTTLTYDLPGAHPLTGTFLADLPLEVDGSPTRLAELLRTGQGVLLTFTDADFDLAEVPVVRANTENPPAPALLIRPDGHIAWAAGPEGTDGPGEAVKRWFS